MAKKKGDTLNERARAVTERMRGEAKRIGVLKTQADCGATILDAGISAPGSYEAGRLFTLACMADTADVRFEAVFLNDFSVPYVSVFANDPVGGCMAAQYAGWAINLKLAEGAYFAMGSGPARALYAKEAIFADIGRTEKSDVAVIALETRMYPPEAVLLHIADCCGVKPENLTVLLAPTASLVGCVQVSARIVETGMHKLHELGFDLSHVLSACGCAPIPPVAPNDGIAIGWTNDAILYGGSAWYTVSCEDEELTAVLEKLPACASPDYGTPFYQLLKRYDWDFYKIDPLLFSPAVVTINNKKTGKTYRVGEKNQPLLEEQWLAVNGG